MTTTEQPEAEAVSESHQASKPLDAAESPKLCTYDVEEIPVDDNIIAADRADPDVQPPLVNTFFSNEDEQANAAKESKPALKAH